MKTFFLATALLIFNFSNASESYFTKERVADKINAAPKSQPIPTSPKIDNIAINNFLKKYPNLKPQRANLVNLYAQRKYKSIWFEKNKLVKSAKTLYSKSNNLEEEGVISQFAYKDKFNTVFEQALSAKVNLSETELLMSAMYLFYAKKVFTGIDSKKVKEIGWLLPQKKLSYTTLLNTFLKNPASIDNDDQLIFGQYYKLREILKKYRQIEQEGNWNLIVKDSLVREYKPGDSSKTIGQIRQKLAIVGDLKQDSKSNLYDEELKTGILQFKNRNGFDQSPAFTSSHILRLNMPIAEYIENIRVNMERCRWIDPQVAKADRYILVNIPSYELYFYRKGKIELESNVFVGGTMNETVIFSGTINHMVFSPYWNIPLSIVQSEIKTALQTDKNYLANNDVEIKNGRMRQKPGPKNPLGKVKFIFPNINDIYLHGSPSKDLFNSEYRAYSHGCINVNKSEDLAYLILKDNKTWPVERIQKAMDGGIETTCILTDKLPVHMSYFTTWVDDKGEVNFFYDIYERDERVSKLLAADIH